jgi:hypothetical protein
MDDELLVIHVDPTKPEESAPADPVHLSPGIAAVLDKVADVLALLPPELPSTREMDFELHWSRAVSLSTREPIQCHLY